MGIPKWCLVTLCQCQLDQIAAADADGAREDQVRVIMMTMKKMMMMMMVMIGLAGGMSVSHGGHCRG